MTETKNTGEKTLSVNPTKTLTLKRGVEQGVVRQSFSHGRSKAVVVEKVKRRVSAPGEAVPVIELFSSAQLDLALGRANVIHAALLANRASDSFLARCRSLERFRTGVPEGRHGTS